MPSHTRKNTRLVASLQTSCQQVVRTEIYDYIATRY